MHIHIHKKRINWWSSATYPHTPSAWKVCFIPPKLEGAQPKEPEGSASYYLCFWCVPFSMGFGCVQQRRRSDTRRWQSSPTARPRSPSLPGTQAEGFFCEPKEIELQREDLEFQPGGRAHQKLGRRRGSMPFCVQKLYFLAGWWWVLSFGLCCVHPMLLVHIGEVKFFLWCHYSITVN